MPKKPVDSNPNSSPISERADEPIAADLDFETALADLESLVEGMETGEMSLEESLQAFERGVKLTRHCQAALKSAELKVRMLTGNDELVDLELDSATDE
jgi:exodeoxyribonuclease VII small subunit